MNEILINSDDWYKEIKQKCVCGHALYHHALTRSDYHYTSDLPDGKSKLQVSQCTACGIDWENHKFVCEEFRSENE